MVAGHIGTKIDNTRAAFERLRERVVVREAPRGRDVLEEVMAAIEELEVAAEELREQNDQLSQASLAVEATAHSYRDLFDEAPDAFVVTTLDGTIRDANRRAADLLGVACTRLLVRKPLFLFVDAEQRRTLRGFVAELGRQSGVRRMELQLRPRLGPAVRVVAEVSSVRDAGSGRQQLSWILHDLSEAELLADELRSGLVREHETTERLRALDDVKNQLLEDLSHDLRNPLAAILGFASILETTELGPERARDMVRRLGNNTRKLERFLAELLDFDQKTRGFRAVRREPTDVAALALTTAADWTSEERRVSVEGVEPVVVEVEPALVERILENLIVNALKHAPPGGAVCVSVTPDSGGVAIRVGDSGPGIPDEFKPRVFSRYFRLPGTERSGSGMGLHMVSRFAEMHGGRVWVEDRAGGGATFGVNLAPPGGAPAGAPPATPHPDVA